MTTTLKEHLGGIEGELASLIQKIGGLSDTISAELPYRRGRADTKNVFGEV